MTKTIKGRLLDGKVELLEPLDVPNGTDVQVTFEVAEQPPASPRRLYYGMFRPSDGRYTTEEDWQEAKKIWEPRDP